METVPNSVIDRHGNPRFGQFRGELPAVKFRELGGDFSPGWWQKKTSRKRWIYSLGITDGVLLCQAIVDIGYLGMGFCYGVDLYEEDVIYSRKFHGLPDRHVAVNDRPGRGHRAVFRTPGVNMRLDRDQTGGPYRWHQAFHPVRMRHPEGLQLDARVDPSGIPATTAVAPVDDGGIVNVTQKSAALPMNGHLRVASRSYDLDGGVAGFDYTQGFLARRTSWLWAMALGKLADGRRIGLNLVSGFNDGYDEATENALWIGDDVVSLGPARFDFDAEYPDRPWTVRTDDGIVDLWFKPYWVYSDIRRWKVIDSHFVQPAGRFEGRIEIDGRPRDVMLHGVTEDQDITW